MRLDLWLRELFIFLRLLRLNTDGLRSQNSLNQLRKMEHHYGLKDGLSKLSQNEEFRWARLHGHRKWKTIQFLKRTPTSLSISLNPAMIMTVRLNGSTEETILSLSGWTRKQTQTQRKLETLVASSSLNFSQILKIDVFSGLSGADGVSGLLMSLGKWNLVIGLQKSSWKTMRLRIILSKKYLAIQQFLSKDSQPEATNQTST